MTNRSRVITDSRYVQFVPGYAAVRSVKWLKKLQLSKEEAEGPWQRGLNYKTLPPSVTDAKSVDLDRVPSMTEASLFSGITSMDRSEPEVCVTPGDTVMMKASGWAWAGGGRNIVRVDLSGDEGKTWTTATLTDGAHQRFGRAWAWVFWEAEVPTKVKEMVRSIWLPRRWTWPLTSSPKSVTTLGMFEAWETTAGTMPPPKSLTRCNEFR